ncbi:aminomethyl-transferring glycine dehydrogenase subunit GcvPA [Natronosalvus halobius]|uniref:aminomethyl-transferring glycine dehydrogenase subunit GcvPA n=1 Tax=Natronosalvus halobius TaxID=2953746 RepID=UPI0020A0D490|nr:aminomethyl-transferring glycine dehydrogenase subunit GcvPA [Natronosalvus halobius]USZ73658.1 aminomethyl-transferring glycine dehydrogenase subunit GcvPA [Natronosalvus halobius]
MSKGSHPYMPNSSEEIKEEMLNTIGAETIEELYEQIPTELQFHGDFDLPSAKGELELKRQVEEILSENKSCDENLNFRGAGCWQHHVPAVCDEISERREFLTSEWGSPESDQGRNQAWFEFCSQLGELLELDAVGMPVYSWGNAAGFAIRMAHRLNGRTQVLVPETIGPERLEVIENYRRLAGSDDDLTIETVAYDRETGRMNVDELSEKCSTETTAVYYETPTYLGTIESQASEIAAIAHENGAECIAGVDPITLGILDTPANHGADIVVGTTQPLGVHMNAGGGCSGFLATRDEEAYVVEYPTLLLSATETSREGELGFAFMPEQIGRSSYGEREEGNDYTGTSVFLWTIRNAVYLSLMGPKGFKEVGGLMIERAHYAADKLSAIDGVTIELSSEFFKEFLVNFDDTQQTAEEVNAALRDRGIFGGHVVSDEFPELGDSALYCVTEVHTKEDIDQLTTAMREVIST